MSRLGLIALAAVILSTALVAPSRVHAQVVEGLPQELSSANTPAHVPRAAETGAALSVALNRRTRRAGIAFAASAALLVGGLALFFNQCELALSSEADDGPGCQPSLVLMPVGAGLNYIMGITVARSALASGNALRSRGYRVPRWAGITGLVLSTLPLLRWVSWVFALVQLRANHRALAAGPSGTSTGNQSAWRFEFAVPVGLRSGS